MYRYPHAVLLIFCKTPQLGHVKTRLMPELSEEDALAAHLELSRRTLLMATAGHLCPVQLWGSPTVDHSFFAEAAQRYGVHLREQQGRDLGERMHHALTAGLHNHSCALLIGTDCPSLRDEDIETAITALDNGASAVFAPAEDGGYVLVGLNRPQPALFSGITWGTPEVMGITRSRLATQGLPYIELGTQWDVDTAEDFMRYRQLNN
ncbi:MAG: TIGR04282 family arsenosugar biosynthesis glycosyltransferase [Methylomicrobium sp.]